jgi:hypothetical protein
MRSIGAHNSLTTLIQFAAEQQEQLSTGRLTEVLRHARFGLIAGASYTWRIAHNIRLLRRQATLGVLRGAHPQPLISDTEFKTNYTELL